MIRQLSVGDEIDAQCTRCKMILNHTIVAMVETRIVRVKCNTCGGQHAYHQPKEAKASVPRQPAARRTASPKAPPAPDFNWDAELAAVSGKTPATYNMNAAFQPGDVLSHPSFGTGIVKQVLKPNKMNVLFKDGIKLLRCTV